MPDDFIPVDTSANSVLYNYISYKGLVVDYAYDYMEKNYSMLKSYTSLEDFVKSFEIADNDVKELMKLAREQKINVNDTDLKRSKGLIKQQIKALIARRYWKDEGFYKVINSNDQVVLRSISSTVQTVAGNVSAK
ncbi:hypothetical protein D3C86_1714950 [compost metagenome]